MASDYTTGHCNTFYHLSLSQYVYIFKNVQKIATEAGYSPLVNTISRWHVAMAGGLHRPTATATEGADNITHRTLREREREKETPVGRRDVSNAFTFRSAVQRH